MRCRREGATAPAARRSRHFVSYRACYFLYTLSRWSQSAFSSELISSVPATPLDDDVRRCCSSTRTLRAIQIALPRKLGWELLYFFACSNRAEHSAESVDIFLMSPNTL